MKINKQRILLFSSLILLFVLFGPTFQFGESSPTAFSPGDVMKTSVIGEAQISPDGQWIAYIVNVPRSADDKPGPAYRELYVISTRTLQSKPFITGKTSIGSIRWSPDSSRIGFLTVRGEGAKNQVWVIPIDGGEATQATYSDTDIGSFEWHPKENKIAYIASTPESPQETKLKEKGYGFIFYEENLKHKNLYVLDLSKPSEKAVQLTDNMTVWSFVFSPDGKTIAAAMSEKNLVDYQYMFQKLYLLDIVSKKFQQLTDNPGKLGGYVFSPDGLKIAYTAALDQKDHAESQVFVIDIATKEQKNLTIPDFRGHVEWASWKDKTAVIYQSSEGVWSTLSIVPASGGERKVILNGEKTGFCFRTPSFSKDFNSAALIGSSTTFPSNLFYWKTGSPTVLQITNINPWVKERILGKQVIIHYKARDGQEIEGILIYPVDYQQGQKYPLILEIHGGPESLYHQQWNTRYSNPGQVLAGKGYAVFYPNYRASTGYGVKFALEGYKDPAGKEFDDIADGIDYLVKEGIADPERVGLGGGSYGGYAAAWFGTYYTKYVRAVCMFVGISDLISKRGTTDIAYEELYVHSGDPIEKMWKLSLERSPIYWAHQSKSAVLICGGADDTRVHPSQSMELYRVLKMNNHPAVRLVQYPGEGHGNRKQNGQIDLLYRILQWYDWYVKDKKPLDPMPAVDISDLLFLKEK